MRVPRLASQLRQFTGMAPEQHMFKIVFRQPLKNKAPFVPDLDQLVIGQLQMTSRGAFTDMPRHEHGMRNTGCLGHIQFAGHGAADRLATEGPDTPGGAEHGKPAHNAEPRIKGLLGQLLASRDGKGHLNAFVGHLPDRLANHVARTRVDRRLTRRDREPLLCYMSHSFTSLKHDRISCTEGHARDH